MVKNLNSNAGDSGSVLGLGRSPEGRHGNPLQYSYLEKVMDRGTWQVHRIPKCWTRLKQLSMHTHACIRMHALQLDDTILSFHLCFALHYSRVPLIVFFCLLY